MNKSKNNFLKNIYSSQKEKHPQYISRSTNKKVSLDNNTKNKSNNKFKEKFKMSSTIMDMNRFQNQNNFYKKYTSDFFQNNSLYNLMSKNQKTSKNNIKVISIPKTKLLLHENSANNSSLIFNINEDQKMKNNNSSAMSSNKQNTSKIKLSNNDTKSINKNSYQNKEIENKNNINIQKYSNKKNYGKYLNSNNNSKEENIVKNKNNFNCNKLRNNNTNNDLFLDSNNNNNNYITYHKNKNNINNKYILQKILSNLFSSNKKKTNVKKDNNNNRESKYINDSFNSNKMSNIKNINKNNIMINNNENPNIDKRRETPKLKANTSNNKKISGLFSANHKEKANNIITDIINSKSKKNSENVTKRNLSINIHSYNINECKFKTSINYDILNKKQDNNIPKLNLNQVFNLKLYDKNKISNNNYGNNYNSNNNNNMSIKDDRNIRENNTGNISKNKILYFISNNNNKNGNENFKIMTNISNSKAIHNYNKKHEETSNNNNTNKSNNNKKNKFSPKNIYTKDIRKSHMQRFFSYSKEKAKAKKSNNFMNNIKKINFNENKKSTSKNSTRRWLKSNDNKSQSSATNIKHNIKNNNCNSSKFKKVKEIVSDTYINLRKRRSKYSEINKIIEKNNLKCLKYINNSEINNLKKHNNNYNTNETNNKNYNPKRTNHSASHNNLNNNQGKYEISRIGNLFKPVIEKNMRGSYKETNRKRNNLELASSTGNKNKNNNNYSVKKNKNQNNEYYRNIKIKNRYNGIYDSNVKENDINNIHNQIEIEEIVNLDIDENKTKENIFQNSLTMYSIYVLSKYYNKCQKIGLSRISIYDANKNMIPIEYSNTNEGLNINYLFDMNPKFKESNNFPLIINFKEDFCINFYIKNFYVPYLNYIYIYNYSDVNNEISPIKEIKIYKTNYLLYNGCLDLKNPNIIKIPHYIGGEENKENININDLESKEKYNIIKKNEKSLTFTIFKSLVNENLDTNDNNFNTFKLNKYNSARNTFGTNRYSDDNNKNINSNYNISNSFVNNLEYNNENHTDNDNLLFFQSNYENNNNNFINTYKDLSKTKFSNFNYFGSEFNINLQNENNFSKTLKLPNYSSKLFLSSYNSALDDVDNLFRTSMGYVNKHEDSDNNNENNNYESNLNINDANSNNFFFNNNDIDKNYVEFNKISIFLKSNYGHRKYIGLTGIVFIDEKGEKIDIEKAETIGALPKDLRTVYNDDSDNRIFENVFNGINNTNDIDNMWVTRFKKNDTTPYLELNFEEKIKLSKMIIYNYNQKDKLEIGTKVIDIYFDNYYYKTINLIQGTGEVAYVENTNNNNLRDFGQEIFFNNDFENYERNFKMSSTGLSLYEKEENKNIKYASNLFEQCYETPYLPCGYFIKIQIISYYCDKNEANNPINYNENELYLGLDDIEIYNEEGINILNNEHKLNKYKIISNRKMKYKDNENKKIILIQGIYNEEENQNKYFDNENNLIYVFEKLVQIAYIKFIPFDDSVNNIDNKNVYKIKEIKIFCEDKIVFEGVIYSSKPTIILFTSDNKLIEGINPNYLTKYIKERNVEEVEIDNYHSLILN